VTADEQDAARQAEVALEAFRDATWDALLGYRETGELVPVPGEVGGVGFLTVDEAQRSRPDRDGRRLATARRRAANLLAQFEAAGLPVPPDLWDRLAADARARLEDDLLYIEEARRAAGTGPGSAH
jgi:hypothetical protein